MSIFLSVELWTAVSTLTAVVALLRPEIGKLRRKAVNEIKLAPHHRLEIGFSIFGPTLGIIGTLRGTPNDQFVTAMAISVTRERDQATHQFDWAVFRSLSIAGTVHDIQYAASFLLDSRSSKTLNIQFHDQTTKSRIEQPLNELRRHWLTYLKNSNISTATTTTDQLQKLYESWGKNNKDVARAYERLNREFYWDSDRYKATITVETTDPEKTFCFSFEFCISDEQSQLVRHGVIGCMVTQTYDPNALSMFAHVPFERFAKLQG